MTMSTKIVMWPTSLMVSYRQTELLPAPEARSKNSIPRLLHLECCLFSAISVGSTPLVKEQSSMEPSLISPSLKGPPILPNYHNLSYFSNLYYNYFVNISPLQKCELPKEKDHISFIFFLIYSLSIFFFLFIPYIGDIVGTQ